MGRGLKTKIISNGMQGLMFSVLWNYFDDLFNKKLVYFIYLRLKKKCENELYKHNIYLSISFIFLIFIF